MSNEVNNKIIEMKDRINFDIKIKKEEDDNIIKITDKTITLGKEEIAPGIDENIVGWDLSESNLIELSINFSDETTLFNEVVLEPGSYDFSFKVRDIIKFESREKIEMSKMKESHNDKQKIKELEEVINTLNAKVSKLETEKQLSEQVFKAKADEMAKNAASKVEVLKEEIKNKAKEEVDYKTKFAIQKLVDDLLSPLNNLYVAVEAGANSSDANVSGYVKGFQMLTSQIFNTLESHGIVVIQPNVGEIFNPTFHQAQEIVDDASFNKDQIVKLISRGYRLHDRVIRPAIVLVAKGK